MEAEAPKGPSRRAAGVSRENENVIPRTKFVTIDPVERPVVRNLIELRVRVFVATRGDISTKYLYILEI